MPLSQETRKRIEDGIRDWHNPESPARKRFAEVEQRFAKEMQPLLDAIEATERITEQDLRLVIY